MILLPARALATAATSALFLACDTAVLRTSTFTTTRSITCSGTCNSRRILWRTVMMSSSEGGGTASSETTASRTSTTNVPGNLEDVRARIQAACQRSNRSVDSVRLVAVSKIQPISSMLEAYDNGQRCFGENYVQELLEKKLHFSNRHDNSDETLTWHFIGPLQSNKAAGLVAAFAEKGGDIERLTIETVASAKLADKLNKAVQEKCKSSNSSTDSIPKLKIMLQIDTSGEETKSGVSVGSVSQQKSLDNESDASSSFQELTTLCRHIVEKCPHLTLCGLMTIGAPGDLSCFDRLVQCREYISKHLPELNDTGVLELSMGMSDDFEAAIERGATNVRIGSTIFGQRQYPPKK